MDKEPKSGKSTLHEEWAAEEKETIRMTLEGQFTVIQDALYEFLNTASKENPEGISVLKNPEDIFEDAKKELKANEPVLAFAIIEAGLYSVNQKRETLEKKREEREDINDESIEDRIDLLRSLETRYGEVEDFLFTHSDFSEILPSKEHLLKWIADEKKDIERLAEDETKEEDLKKLYASRLKSVVPSYDRFLKGQQVIDDYNTLLSALGERLQIIRDMINDDLLEYMATKNEAKMAEIKRNSKLVYAIRSFLALAEGERNEKIALRR